MELEGLRLVGAALASGTASVVLALAAMRAWDGARRGRQRPPTARANLDASVQPITYLFRAGRLVDATAPARSLLDRIGATGDDWTRLMQWLGPRLPDAPERLADLARLGRIEMTRPAATGLGLKLTAEDLGDRLCRITIADPEAQHSGIVVDAMSLQAMEDELTLLRRALDQTPMLVWRQDADERITWANAAYLRRAEARGDGALGWPLPRLLDAPKPVPGAGTATRRAALEDHGIVSWYDCHSHRMGDETMMFALPADAAVRAERSLREFVQTLTKTFADLPIGLAIFDRQRNLQLFNPALIDLTGLPTGFLTARPTLFDFLDQLREQRMVPEPKDYRSWRQHMANLESAAATGHHSETWSLPNGQTYRVTGRPHPDGAVAFLFENITSEITLTRNFRAELMLSSQVLDGIEDGLAVFGENGATVLTNTAYRAIWGTGPADIPAALAQWEGGSGVSGPGLSALRGALAGGEGAAGATGAMAGPDGRLLGWTVTRLSGGNLMLRFRQHALGKMALPDIAATVPRAAQAAAGGLSKAVGAE